MGFVGVVCVSKYFFGNFYHDSNFEQWVKISTESYNLKTSKDKIHIF